jgi:hypothetical protein
VFSILAKQETIINIFIYNRRREYLAAGCCTQVLWMKQTLIDIQVEYDEPIPIYCDNTSTISISKNPWMHSKMKHISTKYHFLPEQFAKKNNRVEYVGTKEQKHLDYGIQKEWIYHLFPTQMQIG